MSVMTGIFLQKKIFTNCGRVKLRVRVEGQGFHCLIRFT